MKEKIQKILSESGCGSRRLMENCILQGRVTVNGRKAKIGDRADPVEDCVCLDGYQVRPNQKKIYLMLYKPRGVVTTLNDEHGRPTIADLVHIPGSRVWPVGRLDMDSEGLLLLTNDGELTNSMTHPRYETEKEYIVTVRGKVMEGIPQLRSLDHIGPEKISPAVVVPLKQRKDGQEAILSVTIHEGKNRQIRRMCEKAGLKVTRLKRVREGSVRLDENLKPGEWRYLKREEIASIRCKISN